MRHKRKTSAVVVAATASIDRQKELATYTCSDCGHNTVVQSSIESPFCVHCGGEHLEPQERASAKGHILLSADDAELASVKCPGCGSHLILTTETASAHADGDLGHLHCPACATEICFQADDLTEEEEPSDSVIEDATETPAAMSTEDTEIEVSEDTETEVEGPVEEPVTEEESEEVSTVEVKALSAFKGTPRFVQLDKRVLCMVDTVCVASKIMEGDVTDYINTLNANTNEQNAGEVLASNNFDLHTVTATADAAYAERVSALEAQHEQALANLTEDMRQSLSIALCGLNRGFFTNNPLRSTLKAKILASGVTEDEAESVLDEAFEESGDDYVEALREETSKIMQKSQDVRNELAHTIMQVRPTKHKTVASLDSALGAPMKAAVTKQTEVSSVRTGSRVLQLAQNSKLFTH